MKTYLTKLNIALLIALHVFSLAFANGAQAQDMNYRSQSLYIYRFTKMITWPTAYSKDDFVIGVFGNSDIVQELTAMASLKKAANGQRIVVKQVDNVEDIKNFHIIYIASAKSRDLQSVLDKVQNMATLVIAEREGMAKKGAGINFVSLDAENLRFDFNKTVLSKHQLKFSDELTALGSEVN